jgi:hypothetical protein
MNSKEPELWRRSCDRSFSARRPGPSPRISFRHPSITASGAPVSVDPIARTPLRRPSRLSVTRRSRARRGFHARETPARSPCSRARRRHAVRHPPGAEGAGDRVAPEERRLHGATRPAPCSRARAGPLERARRVTGCRSLTRCPSSSALEEPRENRDRVAGSPSESDSGIWNRRGCRRLWDQGGDTDRSCRAPHRSRFHLHRDRACCSLLRDESGTRGVSTWATAALFALNVVGGVATESIRRHSLDLGLLFCLVPVVYLLLPSTGNGSAS